MNDFKFAFRQLLKNPGFTAVAVLTLALGIAANTAIFSLIDHLMLRLLPVRNPAELLFKRDRVDYWLSRGAQPSETVRSFLKKPKEAPGST